jgi:heat shock protein HslJ
MNLKLLFLSTFILILIGCGSENDNQIKPSLESINWKLISYGYQSNEKTKLLADTNYTLDFSSSEVSGSISCNTFTSVYEVNESNLTISTIAATEISCPLSGNQDYEDQNNFIIGALADAQSFSINELELTITSVDSSQLIYLASDK